MEKNRICQSIILGLLTLTAAASWYWLKGLLYENTAWYWPLIGFFVLSVLVALSWILIKSTIVSGSTLILILIPFLFSFGFHMEYYAGLVIAFCLIMLASFKAIREKRTSSQITCY